MNNKIIKLVAFLSATCLLIFLPGIFTLCFELYLDVTMKSTGMLPTINTQEKLEELVNKSVHNYSYLEKDLLDYTNSINTGLNINTFGNSFDSISKSTNFIESAVSSTDYSSTNIQVEGIDEADIIKNDGKYIYTIANNKLVIINAFPVNEMKKISEIEIDKEYEAIDLYISGDKLFLVTSKYGYSALTTKVLVFDITNRTEPKVVKTFEVTGSYVSSRMNKDTVYLFTNLYARKGSSLIVPEYRENEVTSFIKVPLDEIQYVPNDKYSSYTQIIAFDLQTPLNSPKIVTYLGSSAENVYMSRDNLYMAQTKWDETKIYKFNLTKVYPRFEAKGVVEGEIINQFAMDEYDGNFRIATTKNNVNRVFVLSESMHKLGTINNIARGEEIKSVRFEGDRGYIVTFRNTDPLFVLELSNPRAPKILGELKIPGYSTYLHTYDENHVIGFGYDGTEFGTNGKLKLALFDISDVNNPQEKFKEVIDARSSELLTNHKALLFSKEKNLIAFPVSATYSYRDPKIGKVYTVDAINGFTLRGDVKHDADVNRMIYIGDVLYGVSESSVSGHNINTVEVLNKIKI